MDRRAASTSRRIPSRIYWRGRAHPTAVVHRERLAGVCRGPAIICEFSATTFVAPGWRARADAAGNMLLERASSRMRS
jgi:N-methylhydantoinase A/oxoprolinase/acetone carboxylase beta subunit